MSDTRGPAAGPTTRPRVVVRRAVPADQDMYVEAVTRSYERIRPWNPVDPGDFPELMARQGESLRTFLVLDAADGGLAARVNVSNIVRGRFRNASLGYDAYLPYAGTGRTAEGLAIVVDRCFASPAPHATGARVHPDGLELHRLEVNVQPGNTRSLALARRIGFRHEGTSPRMLLINGAWRDHERFALTVEEWPGAAAVLARLGSERDRLRP
jgi:ribosomal-protein-alanine N-acetyltransferase